MPGRMEWVRRLSVRRSFCALAGVALAIAVGNYLGIAAPWRAVPINGMTMPGSWGFMGALVVLLLIGTHAAGSTLNPERRFGRVLLIFSLLLWGSYARLAGTVYYASPAGGGAASCVDAGANVCSLTRCTTVGATGDTCQLTCGAYDLGSSGVNFIKNLTYQAATAECAVVSSSNATRTIALNPANNATPLVIDGLRVTNTGGATQNTVQVGDQAFDATVEVKNSSIDGGTVRHFNDAWTRGVVKLTDVKFTGTIGSTGAFVSSVAPSAAKKLLLNGISGSLTTTTNDLRNAILVQRAAGNSTSFFASIKNIALDCTAPAALGNQAACMIVRVDRVTNGTDLSGSSAPVEIGPFKGTATAIAGTVNDTGCVAVSSTDSTAVAHNPYIHDIDCTVNSPVTRALAIGIDGVTTSYVDNARIEDISLHGTFYNASATPHGLSFGRVNGGILQRFYIDGFAVAILTSINNGATSSSGIVYGAFYAPLFAKGNTAATFANIAVVLDDKFLGAKIGNYGCMGIAPQLDSGAVNHDNAATLFANVICFVKNGDRWKYVAGDASQVATFAAGDYWSLVPLSTPPWSYAGSTYNTVTAWAAAREASALNIDPQFVGEDSPKSSASFVLKRSSPLRRAGVCFLTTGCVYRGLGRERGFVPPAVGPYQR